MKSIKENTQLAAGEAITSVRSLAFGLGNRFSKLSRAKRNTLIVGLIAGWYGAHANVVLAASGCKSDAAKSIVDFVNQGVQFLMIIVGVLAVLMAIVGGLFVVTGGNRTKQGFDFLKNSLYGLGIVAVAFVIQEVLLDFLSGASDSDTPGCLKEGNTAIG